MKKFNFKLQQLLELRKLKEDEELNKLYLIQRKYAIHNQRFQSYMAEKNAAIEGDRGDSSLQFNRHLQMVDYIKKLEQEMDNERKAMERVQDEIDEQQNYVRKAKKDRLAIERLRQRAFIEYRKEIRSEEQAVNDETATTIFLKKRYDFGF